MTLLWTRRGMRLVQQNVRWGDRMTDVMLTAALFVGIWLVLWIYDEVMYRYTRRKGGKRK